MAVYHVRAVRSDDGWVLHVDGVGVTQTRTLAAARRQVRDLIETLHPQVDASAAIIRLQVGRARHIRTDVRRILPRPRDGD